MQAALKQLKEIEKDLPDDSSPQAVSDAILANNIVSNLLLRMNWSI